MIYRFLNLLALVFFFFSCKNTETFEDKLDNEIILAFNNVNKVSIKRDIGYLPRWQDRIEFEGSFYIPLNTDKTLSSFTSDSVKYSLDDKIWLKANKRGDNWKFKILTILPNNVNDNEQSGIFMYEDWEDGKLSYDGYIKNKLLNATSYEKKMRVSASSINKIAAVTPIMDCRMVTSEVCAGSGDYEYCRTRHHMLCGRSDFETEGGGAGSGGLGGGGGSDSGGSSGNGNVPPIIPPIINSRVAIKKFNDAIDDTNLPDCMKQVLAALKNLNGNTVADIIKKFAGEVPGYNLNFNVENNNDYSKIARVDPQVNSNFVTIWLNINRDAIGNVTDLAVAATILHESVHAYLVASSFDDPAAMQLSYPELFDKKARLINNIQNDKQHEIMTKNFIKDIAISLKEFGVAQGYNYSTSYYDDLAWKGLYGTKAFNNLDNISKTRIINIIKAEQYGITKQAEGIIQKGKKLGC